MPRNPNKQPCQVPTCRSWARRGSLFCLSHQPRLSRPPAHPPAAEDTPDDLSILEAELLRLLEARAEFQSWAREQRALGSEELTPAVVLKALGDASARLVQLLRARRDLAPKGDTLEELVELVWQELQANGGTEARHV